MSAGLQRGTRRHRLGGCRSCPISRSRIVLKVHSSQKESLIEGTRTTLFLIVALLGTTARSETPRPLGGEFQINTYTPGFQLTPVAVAGAQGEFLVVWSSFGSDGTDDWSSSIQGQRFDVAGNPSGGEFQINTYTRRNQEQPDVAPRGNGTFVVVWESYGSPGTDTDDRSIQGQRLDATGGPIGNQFQVNTYTTQGQRNPEVGVGADGSFVVVWESFGSEGTDTTDTSIQGQLFNAAGTAVGNQFQVNTYTSSLQISPGVVVDSAGDFVVVWSSLGGSGPATDPPSVKGQLFDSNGLPVGNEFLVNTYTTSAQIEPAIALGADDDFVVVWHSNGSSDTDSSFASIQGQRFDSFGNPAGGEFQVNSYTSGNQVSPAISTDPHGNFIVAWEDFGSPTDSSYSGVQVQSLDAVGERVGDDFQANTYTTHLQHEISVASHAGGDFLVVWESRGSSGADSSDSSIQGQRYGSLIFADGLESGDTASWSATQ